MPRRVGRPTVKRDPQKRVPLATRVKGSIYNQLIEAAEANDRPLGNEIELTIERAALIESVVGSLRTLLPAISAFDRTGERFAAEWGVEGDWRLNPDAYRRALSEAVTQLLVQSPGPWDGEQLRVFLNQALMSAQQIRVPGAIA